jgi:hypothetical protein
VVARTSALLILAVVGNAAADVDDAEIIGEEQGWRIEDVELRTTYLDQSGRGHQSQDGPLPGSEDMFIIQPSARVRIRQSERIVHDVTLPIDAISAASPDAVDATTSASKNNIAGDLDIRSAFKLGDHDTLTTRFIAHAEEWIGGGTIGAGWKRSLADDNATIAVNGTFGYDVFDDHDHFGSFLGKTHRATTSVHVAGSQLLSPTTVIDGSYGLTYQRGTLRTGWNAVPTDTGMLTDEVFPRGRMRHALTGGIAQHVPQTRSTVKARYRFYADDFGLRAHTIDASVYQYLSGWLYVRAGYRFHDQNGVDFFTTALPAGFSDTTPFRTADSDLAPLSANEVSLQLATLRGAGPLRKWSASTELFYYQRSNDLRITAVSLSIGRLL